MEDRTEGRPRGSLVLITDKTRKSMPANVGEDAIGKRCLIRMSQKSSGKWISGIGCKEGRP